MEDATRGTDHKVMVPLGKEERENLVVRLERATNILKNESDDEVLVSIVELLEDLETNAGMRDGLKSFQNNGWAVILKTKKQNCSLKLQNATTSSSMMLTPGKSKQILESRLKHESHPLNTDLILKNIFEFSSVSDLKSCRLVSKKWRDLSLGSWRQKAVLQTGRLVKKSVNGTDYGLDPAVAGFTSFIKNTPKVLETPFQHYDMNINGIDLDLSEELKIKQKKLLLDFFGSSVQHLSIKCEDLSMMCLLLTKLPELRVFHLELDCPYFYREYKAIISNGRECPLRDLQSSLAKLSKLELKITIRSPNSVERNVHFPWKKIFESVPAIKSFHLHFSESSSVTVTDEIIESLCEVRKEGKFATLNLKKLGIITACYTRSIVECQFPLQWFSVTLRKDENGVNPSWISDLVMAQAKTLEYIVFGICPQRTSRSSQLLVPFFSSKIELPKLKILGLTSSCFSAFHLLSSLDLPNLLILTITSGKMFEQEQRDVECDACMRSCSLPYLNDFTCDTPMTVYELQSLVKCMPNLTRLHIPLGERTLPIIYQLWPGLQLLHLEANAKSYLLMDDYAITGLPVAVEGMGDQPQLESRAPNITDLKNLREFVLETKPDPIPNLSRPRRAWISDVSAVYGFLQLPKLQILHLDTVCKFSPNVKLALEDHVSEIKISEPSIFQADEEAPLR